MVLRNKKIKSQFLQNQPISFLVQKTNEKKIAISAKSTNFFSGSKNSIGFMPKRRMPGLW